MFIAKLAAVDFDGKDWTVQDKMFNFFELLD